MNEAQLHPSLLPDKQNTNTSPSDWLYFGPIRNKLLGLSVHFQGSGRRTNRDEQRGRKEPEIRPQSGRYGNSQGDTSILNRYENNQEDRNTVGELRAQSGRHESDHPSPIVKRFGTVLLPSAQSDKSPRVSTPGPSFLVYPTHLSLKAPHPPVHHHQRNPLSWSRG